LGPPRKRRFSCRRQDPRRANSASPTAGKTLAAQTALPLPQARTLAAQTMLPLPQTRPSPRKQHFPNRRQDPRRANSASPAADKTLAAQTVLPLPQAKPARPGQGHMPQPKPARRQQQAAAAFPCQQARPAATGKIKKPERTYMRPSALLPSVYKELHASKRDNFFIFCVILNQRTHK